jgi:glycosyltransferase involved in cell wall biosynthesis
MNIYFFQWISELGGADTRLKDLIKLFSSQKKYKLYSVPNDDFRLKEEDNLNFLKKYNVSYLSWKDLPDKLDGIGIAFCNFRIFSEDWRIKKIKESGLKFIWSNDMMWHTSEEIRALDNNMIDAYLYTSDFHLEKMTNKSTQNCKEFIIPNYFDVDSYSYFHRNEKEIFTIGKHSRPDPLKFSEDFPLFYENLNLKNPKYRVMGFNNFLLKKFNWHNFDNKWELLGPNKELTSNFLSSLDTYIYNSHDSFIENQSRAIIEAALNGLPIIAPNKYNFPNQIFHGKTGFLWNTYEECCKYAKILESDFNLRIEMGKNAHEISKLKWCDKTQHIDIWENLFTSM